MNNFLFLLNVVYDNRGCFIKNLSVKEPEIPYKTMVNGKTIPCAIAQVYEYFTLNNQGEVKSRENLVMSIGTL